MLNANYLLILNSTLFVIGLIGTIVNRTNLVKILLCLELMLIAAAANFVVFAAAYNQLTGQIFTLFILTVAAAETAIGLALIIAVYRQQKTIAIEKLNGLNTR